MLLLQQRGSNSSDSTGTGDSIVNQLLSKIDGVDSINNVLIIGMTNRKDMIDDAILRPGRLEVHVEIGLPDEAGRLQILGIHTAKMSKAGVKRISDECVGRLPELAARSKNFSGAELSGLVRTATASAMDRCVNKEDMSVDATKLCVEWDDFEVALTEVQPKFGAPTSDLTALFPNGEQALCLPVFHYILLRSPQRLVRDRFLCRCSPCASCLCPSSVILNALKASCRTAMRTMSFGGSWRRPCTRWPPRRRRRCYRCFLKGIT